MGKITVAGASKHIVHVDIEATGDPYGHELCEGDCHWDPHVFETLYMSIEEASALIKSLQQGLRKAKQYARKALARNKNGSKKQKKSKSA